MKFKTWLETHIQIEPWGTLIKKIEAFIERLSKMDQNYANLLRDYLRESAHTRLTEEIRRLSYRLAGTSLGKDASSLRDQLEGRRTMTQKDTFQLRSGVHILRAPRAGRHNGNFLSNDANKKITLLKLFNWANSKLSKYKEANHLIAALEKNAYDELTWRALLDFAEENDVPTHKTRVLIDQIFAEKPEDQDGYFGWKHY